MSKPVIAVDIDEVLLPHFQDLITWYNKKHGTRLTLDHNHPTDPRPWGTDSVPEAVRRVQQFFETPIFKNAQPFADAVAVLKHLSQTYTLVVVSSRDVIIEQSTRKWLDTHFAGLFTDAQFTARYSLEGKSRSKVAVSQLLRAKYLIDDELTVASEAAKVGIRVLLFGSYPWNQADTLPGGVRRCVDWLAVQEYFDEQN